MSTARRCTRCATPAQHGQRRLLLRRVARLPDQHLQRGELLGRPRLHAVAGAGPGDERDRHRRVRSARRSRGTPRRPAGRERPTSSRRSSARAAQTPTTVTGAPPRRRAPSITGLTNGTTYTFTVTASNPNGGWPAAIPSNARHAVGDRVCRANGGFETAPDLAGPPAVSPPERASTTNVHSGSASALLGSVSGTEPIGDSSLSQTITVRRARPRLSSGTGRRRLTRCAPGRAASTTGRRRRSGAPRARRWPRCSRRNSQRPGLDAGHLQHQRRTPGRPSSSGSTCIEDGSTPTDDSSMYLDDVS